MHEVDQARAATSTPRLAREMGLLGLTATGVCSMVGAGINVIPFMIQRNVPGIGPHVLRGLRVRRAAGGARRIGLRDPRLGDAARGRQLRLCQPRPRSLPRVRRLVLAVVLASASPSASCRTCSSPFCATSRWRVGGRAAAASSTPVRCGWRSRCGVLWTAVAVNLRGVELYQRLIVPLMFLTFRLGGVVIVAGFSFDPATSPRAVAREGPRSRLAEARSCVAVPCRRRPCSSRRSSASIHCAGRRRSAEPRP